MIRAVAYTLWALIPFAIYFAVIRPRLHGGFLDTFADRPFIQRWRARFIAFRSWLLGSAGLILAWLAELGAFAHLLPIPERYQSLVVLIASIAAMMVSRGLATTPVDVAVDDYTAEAIGE